MVNSFLTRLKQKKQPLKNEKGYFSLLYLVVILIAIVGFVTFANITVHSYVLREVQGIMDTSALNALRMSVSSELLKDEYLGVMNGSDSSEKEQMNLTDSSGISGYVQSQVRHAYQTELNQYLKTSNYLESIAIRQADVYFEKGTHGVGTSTERVYIVLDSVVDVLLEQLGSENYGGTFYNRQYSSAMEEDGSFQIISSTPAEDGKVQIVVRSVTKLTYR